MERSARVVEQIIRPHRSSGPQDHGTSHQGGRSRICNREIEARAKANERVLVTTLTKKMSEDLTDYLANLGVRVRYLHSEIETIERVELLTDLRSGNFDVLVGIKPPA